jgi:hypothetical protein
MATINVRDNQQVIDYLSRDFSSFRKALVDLIPAKLPEWTDRSEADFGVVLIELFAYMGDILSYYQDRLANESFLNTARERRSVIDHLRLIGYEPQSAAPASAALSAVVGNDRNGVVDIRPRSARYRYQPRPPQRDLECRGQAAAGSTRACSP